MSQPSKIFLLEFYVDLFWLFSATGSSQNSIDDFDFILENGMNNKLYSTKHDFFVLM